MDIPVTDGVNTLSYPISRKDQNLTLTTKENSSLLKATSAASGFISQVSGHTSLLPIGDGCIENVAELIFSLLCVKNFHFYSKCKYKKYFRHI